MSHKIKTIVRLRPTLPSEPVDGGITIEPTIGTTLSVVNPRETTQRFKFSFPSVYGPEATQEDIWKRDVKALVANVWDGLVRPVAWLVDAADTAAPFRL